MIEYFVSRIADGKPYMAWSDHARKFVPAEQKLYVTYYSDYEAALARRNRLRRLFPKMAEDLYVDSTI